MAQYKSGVATVPKPRIMTSIGEAYSAAMPKGAEYWWWILWMYLYAGPQCRARWFQ